jgi:hypothetical protein
MSTHSKFLDELKQTSTEEEVKFAYAKNFKIKFRAPKKRDLYTPQILFEFKYHKNLQNVNIRSTIIAQALYYIHRIKFGITKDPLPPIVCIADNKEGFFTETSSWKDIYNSDKYDWDGVFSNPSNPDEKIIRDVSNMEAVRKINVFSIFEKESYAHFEKELNSHMTGQMSFDFMDKKEINEYNFVEVYDYWAEIFGDDVKNGTKASKYFLCDIQKGKSEYIEEENKIVFHLNSETKTKKLDHYKYKKFWNLYDKVKNEEIIREIITKLDCLTDEKTRRFTGEFFTPPRFANKALQYIESIAGKKWWKDPNYRLWDMAAGTGNLEWYLHIESYKQIYLSTLIQDDVNYCKRLFPKATSFKYDYINDDIDYIFSDLFSKTETYKKLPDNLIKDLNNDKIKWIILMNPPFGTAQPGKLQTGKYKSNISKTSVQKVMNEKNLGEVSRELFSQFIYRIAHEFKDKNALLCLFSSIKYLNSNNDQKLRDDVFQYKFEKGFAFSSDNFSGIGTSHFPIGFLIWNLKEKLKIEKQKIQLDVYDNEAYKIGTKLVSTQHRKLFLNKWIVRPKNSKNFIMPPLGGAITIKDSNSDTRHRTCPNFIGSLMCCGNDFQQQDLTAILSSPQASAGSHSITPEIFKQAMVVYAVRRIPPVNWLNQRDQYMQPNEVLSEEFINNCVIWSIFSKDNNTSSLRNVKYKEKIYNIINHFFPYQIKTISHWDITDKDILKSLKQDNENRFVSEWISNNKFSKEAQEVIDKGEQIYKFYFKNFDKLSTAQFKIEWWDAGLWQIRHSLQALQDQDLVQDLFDQLNDAHNNLKNKLLPDIISYGFVEG